VEPLSSCNQIVLTIGSTIGLLLRGDAFPARQLFTYPYDKRLQFFLDNFEHMLDGVGLVTDLLVPSREVLSLQEEWVWQVKGLRYPTDDRTADLDSHVDIQLFVDRACRVRGDFFLSNERSQVIRIGLSRSGVGTAH